ncbi:MAG: ABC transporter substrate-binding protein [Burkholderiaceae bacterium]
MNRPDSAVLHELAPTGTLRAAINYGNPVLAQRDVASGQPLGVSVDLARELARRFDLKLEFVTFDAAGHVFDALKSRAWDIAFLARDPVRATEIAFTAPYVIIEASYLVRHDSPHTAVDELDREGVRIAVGKGAAYDLYLTRALKHAQLVRAATSNEAIEIFVADALDAAAGVRQPLEAYARNHAGVRVIDGRFTAIEQAMGTPVARSAAVSCLSEFIEEMKQSGFVADALARSGQVEASVAPPSARRG